MLYIPLRKRKRKYMVTIDGKRIFWNDLIGSHTPWEPPLVVTFTIAIMSICKGKETPISNIPLLLPWTTPEMSSDHNRKMSAQPLPFMSFSVKVLQHEIKLTNTIIVTLLSAILQRKVISSSPPREEIPLKKLNKDKSITNGLYLLQTELS